MRDDLGCAVSVINLRFENNYLLFGNLRPPEPPDQFLCFAAEHAPRDNFYPSRVERHIMKRYGFHRHLELEEACPGMGRGAGRATYTFWFFLLNSPVRSRYSRPGHG